MNTVCIVIGLVFLINVIVGWARGFFRVLISVAGAIAAIVVALYLVYLLFGDKTEVLHLYMRRQNIDEAAATLDSGKRRPEVHLLAE